MLEVLNLTKVYKTKGGADVNALDGVSLRFPERGMVFLLGKSGSGKSTLLNVCGGLDTPTSGEIIVKGRSSRDFTGSDFDSYRNTFIGFIFQEYNILNEFSVEDNIALALELQGKPKDRAAVDALLEQVDLLGYAKRKPNTLSGGQKQRIAIARALIKSPEIIMADEPTGALDSNTGKQVFDTLKKLSRDKLVIIVSHDRDFAEQYGDRIIELKDGKILSDVSKTVEMQEAISENVTAVGDTLCIKRGSELSEHDFSRIKEFLKKTPSDVVITGGEREVRAFREVNRMTADGGQEVFRDTDEGCIPKKSYAPEESRFIASKLPLRHAARIGLSGLRTKPFRLCFTALLCTIAFILFGLLSTLTFYDSTGTFRQTLLDSDHELLKVGKTYRAMMKQYELGELVFEYEMTNNSAQISRADIEALSAELGTPAFGAIYADTTVSAQVHSFYYSTTVSAVAVGSEAAPVLGEPLHGHYPTAKNEIAISSYLADSFIAAKAYDADEVALSVEDREDLLGKEIPIDLTRHSGEDDVYEIVGIFESPAIPAEFDGLKDTDANDAELRRGFEEWLTDGTMQMVLVHEDVAEEAAARYNYGYWGGNPFEGHYLSIATERQEDGSFVFGDTYYSNGYYAPLRDGNGYDKVWFRDGEQTLSAGEALVGSRFFFERLKEHIAAELQRLYESTGDYSAYSFVDAVSAARQTDGDLNAFDLGYEWARYYYSEGAEGVAPTEELLETYNGLTAELSYADLNEFLSAYSHGQSVYSLLCERIATETGIESRLAEEKLQSWIEMIRNGDGENRPLNGTAERAIFDELEALISEDESPLWRTPLANEWCDAIDAARGRYPTESELIERWENEYDADAAGPYAAGTKLYDAYQAWALEYAEVAPMVALQKQLKLLSEKADCLYYDSIYDEELGYSRPLTADEKAEYEADLLAYYAEVVDTLPITVTAKLYDGEAGTAYGDVMSYRIVGMFPEDEYDTRLLLPDTDADTFWAGQLSKLSFYVSSESAYTQPADAIYESVYLAYDGSEALTDYMVALYENRETYDESDVNFVVASGFAQNFEMVDSMVSEFKQIFLYVGLAMAIFAALLLSNFISVSISHKRREIGILRAVGARSLDVFKIFFSESFFITALCVVLSIVGSLVICGIVNGIVNELLGASLFVFGILSVLVLVGVALATVLLATFLPVYNAARRKPVESIRSL